MRIVVIDPNGGNVDIQNAINMWSSTYGFVTPKIQGQYTVTATADYDKPYAKYTSKVFYAQGTGNANSVLYEESTRICYARTNTSVAASIVEEYYVKVIQSAKYQQVINSQNFIQGLEPALRSLKSQPEYIKFCIARNMSLPFSFNDDFINQYLVTQDAKDASIYLGATRDELIRRGEYEKAELVSEKLDYYLRYGNIAGLASLITDALASTIVSDVKNGARQVILGNYSDKVTVSGTIGQIIIGIAGIDLPADIRDVTYDISNWQWTRAHGVQFTLDAVGIIPFVGAVKYTDEVKDLVKGGKVYKAVAEAR